MNDKETTPQPELSEPPVEISTDSAPPPWMHAAGLQWWPKMPVLNPKTGNTVATKETYEEARERICGKRTESFTPLCRWRPSDGPEHIDYGGGLIVRYGGPGGQADGVLSYSVED
jgi:hypothetical protein